jgi:hydrogenase expression/formation protein HypE
MTDERHILLDHGSGGRLYRDLVLDVFLGAFGNPVLARLDDAATLVAPGRIAITTDSHVVRPLRFPGGDIGRLAVAGTVNDLATAAARPLALAAAFVIEEGFPINGLRDVCRSMAVTAAEVGVDIVTGDTKVVERGACDGLYITVTGVGAVVPTHDLGAAAVREGDAVILSGSLGDHAVAVLAARDEFHFRTQVESDCAPLWSLVEEALKAAGPGLRFLRDPTRGGLTTVLAELAEESGLGVEIDEGALPVTPGVQSACDLLGLDPLTLANEGKMILVTAAEIADDVVAACRRAPYGDQARRIGETTASHGGRVALRTKLGTRRVLDMPVGELLPRIC